MITDVILSVIVSILGAIFYFLPVVSISDIPYIGEQLSSILATIVGIWNALLITFPYAIVVWNTFLFVIIPFELLLLIGKFFLGHRLPAHTTN